MPVFHGSVSSQNLDGTEFPTVLSKRQLLGLKARALRRGLWFKVLTGIERTMVNLAIRVVRDCVKGAMLAHLMRAVVAKLGKALESQFARVVRESGRPLAVRLGRIAVGWGNKSALQWAKDIAFAQYLAMLHLNSPEAPL